MSDEWFRVGDRMRDVAFAGKLLGLKVKEREAHDSPYVCDECGWAYGWHSEECFYTS